ncbi:hypothetical protein HZH68_002274 [Vespula germanica]|uniref:Uncharacterized protein n=1 Tax=Vespula germanica TaxID=30212 RepID=A0A834KXY5_VESGE|nr:hypothetical protein HZH68_002274 [Vespula germanica]
MTFLFCGFVFDSADEKTKQMPVASEDWVAHPPKIPNSIASSITTVKGATIQNTATIQSNTTAWMSPYSRTPDRSSPNINNNNNNNNNNNHNNHNNHNNNNNNNSGVVILEGCRPPAATTARRFLRWFSRLGQPPIGKSDQ